MMTNESSPETGRSGTDVDPALLDACRARRRRLGDMLAPAGLDGLLISSDIDIRYLTGFIGHDSLVVMIGDEATIVSDSRYEEFLEPWRRSGAANVVMGVRHRLADAVSSLCADRGVRRLGIQAEHVTLAARGAMAAAIGDDRLAETTGLVGRLRMRKDDVEVAMIERALRCQEAALTAALGRLTPGMTELEFCAVLEFEMKARGAFGPSFDPIIATGA
ncbi:MAG: M24 family metallopeptidase, partial [Planctomycetota bacterium]